MKKLNYIYDENGNITGVNLTKRQFDELMDKLCDAQALYEIYSQSNKSTKTIPFEQVKKELLGHDIRK